MAIDLVCGQCQGRLQAEQPAGVVACPHCGSHLQVPGDMTAHTGGFPPIDSNELVTSTLEIAEALPSEVSPVKSMAMVSVDSALLIKESAHPAADSPASFPASDQPMMAHPSPIASVADAPEIAIAPGNQLPTISTGDVLPPATVSRSRFLIVASYASAVSLAFLFLLLQLLNVRTHQLESLPDVVPEIRNGEVALKIAPPEANVPPGHVLAIGKSQRFGSLKVTPLRVTQGPLQFEHALNDPTAQRSPSEPVFKLWLKFENVSPDQRFSPLDSLLLFKRHYQGLGQPELTNQFLCQVDQRRTDGDLHHPFELSPTSEFRIAGQQLDTVLGPGESLETFVPSAETIDDLSGELVWRVQFRKGYHARTRHGVTTLIDVLFHRNDVHLES